jgi:hypothetical protein
MMPEVNCCATRGNVMLPGLLEPSTPASASPGAAGSDPGSEGEPLAPGLGAAVGAPSGKSAAALAPTSATTVRGLSPGVRSTSPAGRVDSSSVTVYSPSAVTATDHRPVSSVVASLVCP